MPESSNKGGRKPRVTDDDLLNVFLATDDPVLSTAEVADAVPIKRRGVLNRLRNLEDAGELASKQIGGRNTVWWLIDDGHTKPPRDGRELVETDADRDETHTSGADSGAVDAAQDGARLDETLSERATDVVDEIDAAVGLEGDGLDWERRRDAVVHLYEHLRRHEGERFRKSQLADVLDAAGVPTGYAGFSSLWSNWVKGSGDRPNLLASFPGVEQRGNGYVFERELVDA